MQNMSLSLNKAISRPFSFSRRSSQLPLQSAPMTCRRRRHQQHFSQPMYCLTDDDDDERRACTSVESETLQPLGLHQEKMPRHVALIPDGNRRWAVNRGLPKVYGYDAGFERIHEIIQASLRCRIRILSVFVFSTQNFNRPQKEVNYLFNYLEKFLQELVLRFSSENVRISVMGDVEKLPNRLQEAIRKTEEATNSNSKLHLIIAVGYGGREDILQACRSLSRKAKAGVIDPDGITAAVLEEELMTNGCRFPSPDLVIRTSGEQRVSNFMLWQSAYTELYFTDRLMPDFGEDDFLEALNWFQRRSRRFGC